MANVYLYWYVLFPRAPIIYASMHRRYFYGIRNVWNANSCGLRYAALRMRIVHKPLSSPSYTTTPYQPFAIVLNIFIYHNLIGALGECEECLACRLLLIICSDLQQLVGQL